MTLSPPHLNSIAVIIPALNEAATIGEVILSLQAFGLSHIRVVDNGSYDGTAALAHQAGAEVLTEPMRGYGQACWRGLQDLPPEIEWILFCDGDGSSDLSQLGDLWAQCSHHDLVLGNRRGTASGRQHLTPVQRFGNALATTLIAWGWGHCYHDLGPLRLIRRQALAQIQMRDRGFGWTVEMQVRAVECQHRICELPVNYRPRQGGKSKISGTVLGSLRAGSTILATLAALYGRTLVAPWPTGGTSPSLNPSSPPSPSPSSPPSSPRDSKLADGPGGANPSQAMHQGLLFLSTLLLIGGSLWSMPHGDFGQPTAIPRFWVGMGVMGTGFVLAWQLRTITAVWFWGVAIVPRLLLLTMHPGSDIWRYLWEGYIQLQGFSPYNHPPSAEALAPLITDWWWRINHLDVSAIYPPMAQFGFRLLASVTPSVILFKAAFAAADLGICGLLSRRFGYRATLFYAWNPLVIYSFAGGGHYDSWFLLPLVAAWLWFDRPHGRSRLASPPPLHWLGSALLIGISIAVKWMSLPILGFLAAQSLRRRQWRLTLGVLIIGFLPLGLSALPFCSWQSCPLIPTSSVFVNYGRSAELIPHLVATVWEATKWQNRLYALPLAAVVLWLMGRATRFAQFAEGYLIALLLLSPIVHGWYFTWLMPFGVASRNLGIRLVSLSAFVYYAIPHRMALGNPGWMMSELERGLLWLPLVVGLVSTSILQKYRPKGIPQA